MTKFLQSPKRLLIPVAFAVAVALIGWHEAHAAAVDAPPAPPAPNAPKWYVAAITGKGVAVAGERYGPFRTVKTATAFCASVPAAAYRCTVEPVLPKGEWLKKGAR